MEDFIKKWEKSKIISEISRYKEFCQDKHDQKLNKAVLDLYQKSNSSRELKGGILFSVCRGSCSEGMNFKNDYARLVIVVGIPYAYLGDPKTQLRKEYQDDFNKSYFSFIKDKTIKKLSGSEWYNQNAIKCVNQALGRVIRHSNDYGCMLLIDSRYQQASNKALISKWIRDLNIIYNNKNNDNLISNAQKFFIEADAFINNKINEKKKLDELKEKQKQKQKIDKKDKNKSENILEINLIDAIKNATSDDDFEEEKVNNTGRILKNKKNKRNKSLPQVNDSKHFNIINDIKLNENKDNDIIIQKPKKKKRSKKSDKHLNDPFLENNFDLAAIFGDDVKINEFNNENEIKANKENVNENINNNNINDEFSLFGASYFDSLKDEGSNKNSYRKKSNTKINNKELTNSELVEKIEKRKDNPDFKEELKKIGLNFTLDTKKENDESNDSYINCLCCPICYNNTKETNLRIESCGCGHFFCKNCLDKLENDSKNKHKVKCPICGTKIKFKERRELYI